MTQKKKPGQTHRPSQKHSSRSVLNLNERIFAALESDDSTCPDWPCPPLDQAESGMDRGERDED